MTTDTTAIRSQYSDGEYLDAYPGEACDTILTLCGEVDRLRAENELLQAALRQSSGGASGSRSVALTIDLRGTTGDRELDAKIARAGRQILAQKGGEA